MNPRYVLVAGADLASSKKAEGQHHLWQCAAASLEHDSGPQQHDAYVVASRRERLAFPVLAELGEEIAAWRCRLVERRIARSTVVAHRAAADERWRRGGRRFECCRQTAGRANAAVAKLCLA